MGPYACNLTLCRLQQDIYHGQSYARVDLNDMPESTLSPSQGLLTLPQKWKDIFILVYCLLFTVLLFNVYFQDGRVSSGPDRPVDPGYLRRPASCSGITTPIFGLTVSEY